MTTIVWFRQDLRIEDHPALFEAIKSKNKVVPLYIFPEEGSGWQMGGAQKVWLEGSLKRLLQELETLNLYLTIRKGRPLEVLKKVIYETKARQVYWSRRYEPSGIKEDTEIKAQLTDEGLLVKSFNGRLLQEPWNVFNKQNKPFQVFTPFYKHSLTLDPPAEPLPKPPKGEGIKLESDTLDLLPKIQWDKGIRAAWEPGSRAGQKLLDLFVKEKESDYKELRDRPDLLGTSRLSPYLHFGELSPRQIYHAAKKNSHSEPFIRQLYWREFAYQLLYHFPFTPEKPLQEDWNRFRWNESESHLKAWQKGLTGYPLVDAGMRELWTTGWMHNRVRMVVGSFLVKDLLINWLEGAKWFWDTLVDADLANNTLGWQWVGGSGADAAPYFRVFNPVLQGEKFDPKGDYVRKWVPELKDLEDKYLHAPWTAPDLLLRSAGIILGKTYPRPIVDHAKAKDEALLRYAELRGKG